MDNFRPLLLEKTYRICNLQIYSLRQFMCSTRLIIINPYLSNFEIHIKGISEYHYYFTYFYDKTKSPLFLIISLKLRLIHPKCHLLSRKFFLREVLLLFFFYCGVYIFKSSNLIKLHLELIIFELYFSTF